MNKPETIYTERCATFGTKHAHYEQRSNRQANISLALVGITLVLFGFGLWGSTELRWLLWLALLTFGGFVVSYVINGRYNRQRDRFATLYAINNEGLQRLHRDWKTLPLRQPLQTPPPGSQAQALANDLDLLGHASLQHLLNTPVTPIGRDTLQRWLLEPAPHTIVLERQATVSELAPQINTREELGLYARGMADDQADFEKLFVWAEDAPWLAQHRWMLWAAWLIPFVALLLGLLQLLNIVQSPLWLVPGAIGMLLTLFVSRGVDQEIARVAARQRVFIAYAELFAFIEQQKWAAPRLIELQQQLAASGLRADQQMRRLANMMPLDDLRRWMFFFPIQCLTLWNVHVLWLLERWRRAAGSNVRTWLTVIGELEALAALATLAADHPDWTLPELDQTSTTVFHAEALRHPLLHPAKAVGNPVELGPTGRFLLITGSNMSGKSTLLRSIGLSVVLAQAGGPVPAAQLRLGRIQLATSIRVSDSLEQGVSYFMAELRRLKAVVELTEATTLPTIPLFLLDEILHGTNTAERQIAARHVIRGLLDRGATGAVSTHDLGLADDPALIPAATLAHFTEQFWRGPDGPAMTFDYTLRPGLATSTNALKLMEIVGLGGVDHESVVAESSN
jgi:hypothetical protein